VLHHQKLNQQICEYINLFKVPNPVNVTFTEKQSFNGLWLDDIVSEQNFRHFSNHLNRKVFGNGWRRYGKRLKMLVVREISPLNRHHLHTCIELPQRLSLSTFHSQIKSTWERCDFGYNHIHIEKPSSLAREEGWIRYMMKTHYMKGFEYNIDWTNSTVLTPC